MSNIDTLKQAAHALRKFAEILSGMAAQAECQRLAAELEAMATQEPSYWLAVLHTDGEGEEVDFGSDIRDFVNDHINDVLNKGGPLMRLVPVYAAPIVTPEKTLPQVALGAGQEHIRKLADELLRANPSIHDLRAAAKFLQDCYLASPAPEHDAQVRNAARYGALRAFHHSMTSERALILGLNIYEPKVMGNQSLKQLDHLDAAVDAILKTTGGAT